MINRKYNLTFLVLIFGASIQAKTICINNECSVNSNFSGVLHKKFEGTREITPAPKEKFLDKVGKKFSKSITTGSTRAQSPLVMNNTYENGYEVKSMGHVQEMNLVLHQRSLNVVEGKPTLLIGTVLNGKMRGAKVIGEAHLDAGTMSISMSAQRIQLNEKTYDITGVILDGDGLQHIPAKINYNDTEALLASSAAVGLGAIADSNVERDRDLQGNLQARPSINNSITKGAIGGLMNAAETYSKRLEKGAASAVLDPNQVFKLVVNSRLRTIK